ncbi:hypothetical protein BT96DRAFT_971556 [Gymnopus androsaceus JB14]|uniref:Uncharacterized protein n=1 Tax=Gymnopus androsaceus JB14 TaxID=1447944 RepID=A0A6A4ICQ5_9AGAR|nr:hypothetical protein BT96DRAFT_971556 [Gymnopus androsaceus JB14]
MSKSRCSFFNRTRYTRLDTANTPKPMNRRDEFNVGLSIEARGFLDNWRLTHEKLEMETGEQRNYSILNMYAWEEWKNEDNNDGMQRELREEKTLKTGKSGATLLPTFHLVTFINKKLNYRSYYAPKGFTPEEILEFRGARKCLGTMKKVKDWIESRERLGIYSTETNSIWHRE